MKEVLEQLYLNVQVDSKKISPSELEYKDGDEMLIELISEDAKHGNEC